jgi:hypothetical protein
MIYLIFYPYCISLLANSDNDNIAVNTNKCSSAGTPGFEIEPTSSIRDPILKREASIGKSDKSIVGTSPEKSIQYG